jgi:hypothetical protein
VEFEVFEMVPVSSHMAGTLQFLMASAGIGEDADHTHVMAICLFVTLLCACIVLGHLLEENRWMNESITALILVRLSIFFQPWKILSVW